MKNKFGVGAMKVTGWTSESRGFDLANLRRIDNQPGAIFITTDQATIEYAKRAGQTGQAVLQYLFSRRYV